MSLTHPHLHAAFSRCHNTHNMYIYNLRQFIILQQFWATSLRIFLSPSNPVLSCSWEGKTPNQSRGSIESVIWCWSRVKSSVGMCEKPKFGSDSVLKTELSKNLTSIQMVLWQKLHAICHSNKKVNKTFISLHVQIKKKNILKHDRNRVLHTDYRMQLHYLLVVVVVSDVNNVKVMSSTVAVIFAITWVANNHNIRTKPRFFKPNRTRLIPNQIRVF